MAGRLHGSTSLCLCDNKTNLHTGQLVPGRMSSLPLFLSGRNFPRIDGGPVEIIGGKRLERKLSVKTDRCYPLFLSSLEYQVCVCVCVGGYMLVYTINFTEKILGRVCKIIKVTLKQDRLNRISRCGASVIRIRTDSGKLTFFAPFSSLVHRMDTSIFEVRSCSLVNLSANIYYKFKNVIASLLCPR